MRQGGSLYFGMGLDAFPGGDLIERGLQDLAAGRESVEALLVAVGAPRLRDLGIDVPAHSIPTPEHRLYAEIGHAAGNGAHGEYNALLRRLVSFERAFDATAHRR